MPSVLFVCTGNICRSPMAAALFERLVRPEESQADWRIESAGTWAGHGYLASPHAQAVMAARGLDTSGHRSRPVSGEMLAAFNLILTMDSGHKEALLIEFPELAGQVYLLSEMVGEEDDVTDPIGLAYEDYEATAQKIDGFLTEGFKRIVELASTPPEPPA